MFTRITPENGVILVCVRYAAQCDESQDIQEGPWVRARVEDPGSGVEGQHEHDEDDEDDPDDHPGAEAALVVYDGPASRRIHVDLSHVGTSSTFDRLIKRAK